MVRSSWCDLALQRPNRQQGEARPSSYKADFLNTSVDDTVLIPATKVGRALGVTEVLIDPATETASGLRFVSVASCNNFITVDQDPVGRTIGILSAATMLQIDACLKVALELP